MTLSIQSAIAEKITKLINMIMIAFLLIDLMPLRTSSTSAVSTAM